MIFIGYDDQDKIIEIERYQATHDIHKVVIISADEFPLFISEADQVTYSDVIMYVTFYRLLQEIDENTLIVINECLRTQNRYDLSYNCIRNYLTRTNHQLIFQQLPLIDTHEDFMILFDFDTGSRWRRRKFDIDLVLDNAKVCVNPLPISFNRIEIPTAQTTKKKYVKEREKRFAVLGVKDPHTLPRNLYLIGGKDKLAYIDSLVKPQLSLFGDNRNGHHTSYYVARNKRLNRENIITYSDVLPDRQYTIIEFPHRFIDFSDFIRRTGQAQSNVLMTDLKVDDWYFNRYTEWSERIHELYTDLQQR